MTSVATTSGSVFRKITAREAAVLLVLAWLVPFLVHLVPWSGERPLGAYLLPVFWASFVAVYFYGAVMGLTTGLLVPAVGIALTGLPVRTSAYGMIFEVILFVLALAWAIRRAPRFWLLAPLGYLAATLGATLLLIAAQVKPAAVLFGGVGAPLQFFSRAITGGAIGLAVLAAINVALVKFYPKNAAQ